MKVRNFLPVVIAILAIVIIFYSFQDSQDDAAYEAQILEERQQTDRFMRTSPESPFASDRGDFSGLAYFPPDLAYRIIARFEPAKERQVVVLTTNDGKEQRYVEYGHATFDLDGIENRLVILEGIGIGPLRGKLFLAFGDETSARETYGAGRYLDINRNPGSSTITLDFNKAYNPYCAYNDTYSCPLPPAENLLKVAIKAGEKAYLNGSH